MEVGKRAQMFTIASAMILVLLFLSFESYSFIQRNDSVKSRISTMSSFLDSIEENLERQLYIAGYRIIFLAESKVVSEGDYVDFDSVFDEAFFNGTVDGEENSTYLTGVVYEDIVGSINDKASKVNLRVFFNDTVVKVSQVDPWNVRFEMISNFSMVDLDGLARWDKEQRIVAYVPVVGFEDPYFTVKTNGKVPKKIRRSEYSNNYTVDGDVSNLREHFDSGSYAANKNAPDFLGRLEGDLSSSENGIESFVDVRELSNQGIVTEEKSLSDHIYFSDDDPVYYEVSGMPSYFYIDNRSGRLLKYNVSEISSVV